MLNNTRDISTSSGSLELDAAIGLDEASGGIVSALAASPLPSAAECVDAVDPGLKGGQHSVCVGSSPKHFQSGSCLANMEAIPCTGTAGY